MGNFFGFGSIFSIFGKDDRVLWLFFYILFVDNIIVYIYKNLLNNFSSCVLMSKMMGCNFFDSIMGKRMIKYWNFR